MGRMAHVTCPLVRSEPPEVHVCCVRSAHWRVWRRRYLEWRQVITATSKTKDFSYFDSNRVSGSSIARFANWLCSSRRNPSIAAISSRKRSTRWGRWISFRLGQTDPRTSPWPASWAIYTLAPQNARQPWTELAFCNLTMMWSAWFRVRPLWIAKIPDVFFDVGIASQSPRRDLKLWCPLNVCTCHNGSQDRNTPRFGPWCPWPG